MEDKTRRVLIRVIGAPIILAILGGVLYWDYARKSHLGLMIIMAIFTAGGLWEFYNMCRLKGYNPARYVGVIFVLITCVTMFILAEYSNVEFFYSLSCYGAVLVIYLFYLLLKIIFMYGRFSIIDASLTFTGFIYLTLWIGAISIFFRNKMETEGIILYLFIINKGSDMVAYCFGKLFGRTKLAPNISPNKTWIGAIAGLVIVTGIWSIIFIYNNTHSGLNLSFLTLTVVTALLNISAQLGDLVKSAIKRWAGVKDSGQILPEFGGFLDIIDSFLISVPLFAGMFIGWLLLYLE